MRYDRCDSVPGSIDIYTEGVEERRVLRAIARVSFAMASPVSMGLYHYDASTVMDNGMADGFIRLPCADGEEALVMDYVQGRQCKTFITKVTDGHFRLDDSVFRRDRGSPCSMLDNARILLEELYPNESSAAHGRME